MNFYVIAKALHIISMTAWMAGMFYLPRLFAYHADTKPGSETSELFKTMERRLLRLIINPAMILTLCFGLYLAIESEVFKSEYHWIHAKLGLVFCMVGLHGFFAKTRKQFVRGERPHSARFYKIINELVTVIFIGIVLLAVTKPF
jgi:putative membrane protein